MSAHTQAHSFTCTCTHSHIQVTSLLECEEEIARLRCKVAGMEKWLSPRTCPCHSLVNSPFLADSRLRSPHSLPSTLCFGHLTRHVTRFDTWRDPRVQNHFFDS